MNIAYFIKPKAQLVFLQDHFTLRQALEKMHRHSYTALPVLTASGGYAGTVNEGDFLWYLLDRQVPGEEKIDIRDTETLFLRDIIRKDIYPAITINSTMEQLVNMAKNQNFVPVTDDLGSFVGIVTRSDIIQYFAAAMPDSGEKNPARP